MSDIEDTPDVVSEQLENLDLDFDPWSGQPKACPGCSEWSGEREEPRDEVLDGVACPQDAITYIDGATLATAKDNRKYDKPTEKLCSTDDDLDEFNPWTGELEDNGTCDRTEEWNWQLWGDNKSEKTATTSGIANFHHEMTAGLAFADEALRSDGSSKKDCVRKRVCSLELKDPTSSGPTAADDARQAGHIPDTSDLVEPGINIADNSDSELEFDPWTGTAVGAADSGSDSLVGAGDLNFSCDIVTPIGDSKPGTDTTKKEDNTKQACKTSVQSRGRKRTRRPRRRKQPVVTELASDTGRGAKQGCDVHGRTIDPKQDGDVPSRKAAPKQDCDVPSRKAAPKQDGDVPSRKAAPKQGCDDPRSIPGRRARQRKAGRKQGSDGHQSKADPKQDSDVHRGKSGPKQDCSVPTRTAGCRPGPDVKTQPSGREQRANAAPWPPSELDYIDTECGLPEPHIVPESALYMVGPHVARWLEHVEPEHGLGCDVQPWQSPLEVSNKDSEICHILSSDNHIFCCDQNPDESIATGNASKCMEDQVVSVARSSRKKPTAKRD